MLHSAPAVSLYLLGPPRIERAGQLAALKYNRARALLAYLALEPGFHTRDSLAELFWPNEPTTQGRDKLKRMLFELREALGERCVEGDRYVVRLAPVSLVWVDAIAFETDTDPVIPVPNDVSVQAGGGEDTRHGWHDALDRCARAVELYRGPLLQGLRIDDAPDFEIWLDGQREAYVRRLVLALSRLARGRALEGRPVDAIRYARRLVDIAAHHEPGWQLLIDLLMQSGRRDEAVHELERCRRALARELDAEPQAATLALVEREIDFPQRVPPASDAARNKRAAGRHARDVTADQAQTAAQPTHDVDPRHGAHSTHSTHGAHGTVDRPVPQTLRQTWTSPGARGPDEAVRTGTARTRGDVDGPSTLAPPRTPAQSAPVSDATEPAFSAACVPRAHARLAMGVAHLVHGRMNKALGAFEATLAAQPDTVVDLTFGADARAMAFSLLSITQWRLGAHGAAFDASARALERARRVADPHTRAYALVTAGVLSQLRGASEQALERTAELLELVDQHRMPHWRLVATVVSGWAVATLGDPDGRSEAEAAAHALGATMGSIGTMLLGLLREGGA